MSTESKLETPIDHSAERVVVHRLVRRLRRLLEDMDAADCELVMMESGTVTSLHIRPQSEHDNDTDFGKRAADTRDDFGLAIGGHRCP